MLCYRDAVKNFACHLLQDTATEESQMLVNLLVALLQLFESLRQQIKIVSCQKSISPSSTDTPTARMRMSEPFFWLKYQVENAYNLPL